MDISSVPIEVFYKRYLSTAFKQGYKWICTIVCRKADSKELYQEIRDLWNDLDDVTDDKFLVIFAGKRNENHEECYQNSIMDEIHTWVGVYNDDISFITNNYSDGRLKCRIDMRNRYLLDDIPINQTDSVSSLKNFFGISEDEVPCLVFTDEKNNQYKVEIPKNPDFYQFFKRLVTKTERIALGIYEVNEKLKDLDYQIENLNKELNTIKVIIESKPIKDKLLELIGTDVDMYSKNFLKIFMGTPHFRGFDRNIKTDIHNNIKKLVSLYKWVDIYPYTIIGSKELMDAKELVETEANFQQMEYIQKQICELSLKRKNCQEIISDYYKQEEDIVIGARMDSKKNDLSNTIVIGNSNENISISIGDIINNNQNYEFNYELAKESYNNIMCEVIKLHSNSNCEVEQKLDQVLQLLNNNGNPQKIKDIMNDIKSLLIGVSSGLLAEEFIKFFNLF